MAAVVALLVAVVTGVALHRSITGPLGDLSKGAREVARGEFGHRIELRAGVGEFTQLANAFNVMIARLGKLDRLKQDFVATVSHDLKSPLASLRETTSLLLDQIPGPLRESQRRVLLLQRESADRLGRMIAKLLELSRLEAGIPLVALPMNVREFVERAVVHADAVGRERGVQVRVAGEAPRALQIAGDEDWLRQTDGQSSRERDQILAIGRDGRRRGACIRRAPAACRLGPRSGCGAGPRRAHLRPLLSDGRRAVGRGARCGARPRDLS